MEPLSPQNSHDILLGPLLELLLHFAYDIIVSKKSGYSSNTLEHVCVFPQGKVYWVKLFQINQSGTHVG